MKVVLTIGGSDSGGGAGIQADLKTFEAHEVFATTAITALTAQNTVSVSDIHQPKSEFVSAQIKAVLDDFEVSAIKIGMLFSKEIIKTVYKELENYKGPLVLDTVFVSRTNSLLLRENAVEELKRLFEKATIITPNMYEAYRLFGYRTGCSESLEQLRSQPCPVLVKNHMTKKDDKEYSVDILYTKNSKHVFETPFSHQHSTHGTGCSYSAAIAANLALGYGLHESIARAKRFVYFAIDSAPSIGKGVGPIGHKEGYRKMKEYYGESK